MSNASIPPHVDPRKLADRGATREGALPLASLTRLCEPLVETDGVVRAKLVFDREERRVAVIRSELSVEVKMICQRCLEPATFVIDSECSYLVVKDDSADRAVPQGYEALEVGEEPLDLLTLIEDELLLALPIVPVHDPEECQQPAGLDEPELEQGEETRPNPFSVLAQLKRDPNV